MIFILYINFHQLFKIVQDFKDLAILDKVMKEILTEEQNKIQHKSGSIEVFVFAVFIILINEYINLNLIASWISLIQWFTMIFDIHYISVEFIYLSWVSLPSAATKSEHYSQSNFVITKNAIPPCRTLSPPYVPHEKSLNRHRHL